jgi:hypothetical protein
MVRHPLLEAAMQHLFPSNASLKSPRTRPWRNAALLESGWGNHSFTQCQPICMGEIKLVRERLDNPAKQN